LVDDRGSKARSGKSGISSLASGKARPVPAKKKRNAGPGAKHETGGVKVGKEEKEAKEEAKEEEKERRGLGGEASETPPTGPGALLYNIYFWLAVAGTIILVLAMGVLLAPDIFWDEFIWKYYVSAVVADANEEAGNEYNPVDTTTYGLLLAISVFLLYRLLRRWKVRMGTGFFLAVLPYIVLGGAARVMEDSGLFEPPLRYLFITPGMWILTGLGTLAFLTCAVYINRLNETRGHREATLGLAVVLGGFFAIHAVVTEAWSGMFNSTVPHWVMAVLTAAAFCGLLYYSLRVGSLQREADEREKQGETDGIVGKREEEDEADEADEAGDKDLPGSPAEEGWYSRNALFFTFGALLLAMPVYLVLRWLSGDAWTPGLDDGHTTHWEVLPQSLALALVMTAVVVGLSRYASGGKGTLAVFGTGTSAVLFFSHFLDASATYIGIEMFNYTEMHVLPTFLIETTGTALVMFPLKFFVVAVVLYFLDVEYREEMLKRPQLFGMVKLCIAILGLAPGIRDALRTSMGV
jgi:uncharacterized membrane protein